MRRIIIIAILFSSGFIFAQGNTKMALRMGLNNAKVLNSTLHTKPGLYVGLALAVQFTENYTLQPEITYSKQGGASETQGLEDIDIN